MPLLVSEPAAVAVGIAQGAIDHYIEILKTRHQYGPASPLRRELTMFQRDLGQATALVDTAEAALIRWRRLGPRTRTPRSSAGSSRPTRTSAG